MRKTIPARKQSTSVPGPEPAPAPKFTPRGSTKERLLVAVADDKFDFASMSSESGKRLNELMHKPEVQKQFNIGPQTERFDPRHCKRVWEGVGHILAGIGGFVFKWPESACAQFKFTEEEKDELAGPTAAALDELAPAWLKEHQAVAALLVVSGAIIQNKMRAAALEARRVALERQAMVNAAAGVPPGAENPPAFTTPPVTVMGSRVRVVAVPTAPSGIEMPPPKPGPNGGATPPTFGGTSGKVGA